MTLMTHLQASEGTNGGNVIAYALRDVELSKFTILFAPVFQVKKIAVVGVKKSRIQIFVRAYFPHAKFPNRLTVRIQGSHP